MDAVAVSSREAVTRDVCLCRRVIKKEALTMDNAEHLLPGLDPNIKSRVVTQEAVTQNVHRMLHEGHVRQFTFHSDEPPDLWGEDEHPRPLDYILAGIGF